MLLPRFYFCPLVFSGRARVFCWYAPVFFVARIRVSVVRKDSCGAHKNVCDPQRFLWHAQSFLWRAQAVICPHVASHTIQE